MLGKIQNDIYSYVYSLRIEFPSNVEYLLILRKYKLFIFIHTRYYCYTIWKLL